MIHSRSAIGISKMRAVASSLLVLALLASLLSLSLPGRAAGTFEDDDDSQHRAAIEYLAASGVTRGCNPPADNRFCPQRRLTRGEMAAFVNRALDLEPSEKDWFRDDGSVPFEKDIQALAASGLTRGCNPPTNDRYCPHRFVTRGEMAAFMARALDLPEGEDFFTDDNGSVFERDINRVATVGISRGCNPPDNSKFCLDRPVTRGEMATFLMRMMEIDRNGITSTTTPNIGGGEGDGVSDACDTPLKPGPSDPSGDVRVEPGESIQAAVDAHGDGARIVIAAGVHRRQMVTPKHGNQFIGEPGAILDGGGTTEYAFGGYGDEVLIEGLEITNYASDLQAGTIRSVNSSVQWTVRANEIHHNQGQGIKVNHGWRVLGNHIHHNEQFGVAGGGSDVLIEGNVISFNNWEGTVSPFRGAGGTKFVRTERITIRNNCSHDNHGPGLWTDGHNVDTVFENNTVLDNYHAGIKHEVSCSAIIRGNTAIGNGDGNPHRIKGAGILVINSNDVLVTDNVVRDNSDGIAGVMGERDDVSNEKCNVRLEGLRVTDNVIGMNRGFTGIVTHGIDAVWNWNNRFANNQYELSPGSGAFFFWEGNELSLSEWKRLGND